MGLAVNPPVTTSSLSAFGRGEIYMHGHCWACVMVILFLSPVFSPPPDSSELWPRMLVPVTNRMKVARTHTQKTRITPPLSLSLSLSLSPDVGAPHMQLMLMVWHSFSHDTRRALLTQCAGSVVTVAKTNRYTCTVYIYTYTCTLYMYIHVYMYMHMCVHCTLNRVHVFTLHWYNVYMYIHMYIYCTCVRIIQ